MVDVLLEWPPYKVNPRMPEARSPVPGSFLTHTDIPHIVQHSDRHSTHIGTCRSI